MSNGRTHNHASAKSDLVDGRNIKRVHHWSPKASLKGTGFKQPSSPHKHWHIDIAYLNISGTIYYLCMVLDGYSRFIVHWEIRESMTEMEIEIILERARERFPNATPRI
ncbi:MAG: transposase family protein, partial [Deltaproteobacteria bacterium]|nr:transposase family protein [Deltaproteobacteria bacterium]